MQSEENVLILLRIYCNTHIKWTRLAMLWGLE